VVETVGVGIFVDVAVVLRHRTHFWMLMAQCSAHDCAGDDSNGSTSVGYTIILYIMSIYDAGAQRLVLPGASFLGERVQNSQGSRRRRRRVPDRNAVLISSAATLYIRIV
jgi:hypothetical protein